VLSALPRSALEPERDDNNGDNSPRQRVRLIVIAARLLSPPSSSSSSSTDSRKRRRKEQEQLARGQDPHALPHRALEACVRGLERQILPQKQQQQPQQSATLPLPLPARDRRALLGALLSLYPRPAAGGPNPLALRHPRLALYLLRGAAAAAVLDARQQRGDRSSSSSSSSQEDQPPARALPLLMALRQACALGVRDGRSLSALERALCVVVRHRAAVGDDEAAADALGLFARLAFVPRRLLMLLSLQRPSMPATTLRAAARLAWGAAVCGCLLGADAERRSEASALSASTWGLGRQALRAAAEMEEEEHERAAAAATAEAAATTTTTTTTTAARAQLHHARLLLLEASFPPPPLTTNLVPPSTARAWADAAARCAKPATPTAAQRRAFRALALAAAAAAAAAGTAAAEVLLEHPAGPDACSSGVRVDVAVLLRPPPPQQAKVAVEVDGPAHFVLEEEEGEEQACRPAAAAAAAAATATPPLLRWRERADGAAVARTWLLQRWGWVVVRLKAREVDHTPGDRQGERQEEEESEAAELGAALLSRVALAAAALAAAEEGDV
jgi:hypothetical protein